MTTMTGGEAVVAALEALGVDTVFGIVSIHNVPTLDAIGRSKSIEFIACRHEQGAVHAADGYARASGKLGVALTSTGPGAANTMGGMFEANYASSPVLMITGQVETSEFGRGRGTIHQAEQQLAMLRTVTKRAEHIERADDIAPTIMSVALDMLSGRPGPGAIEIPIDQQYAPAEVAELRAVEPRRTTPSKAMLEKARELIASAQRPLIIAGGGIGLANAGAELTALAEKLSAPVLTTVEGRGAIPETHALALGPNIDMSAMDPVMAQADVVIAVGTRFQQNTNVLKWLRFPGKLIHLDADPTMIGRVHPAEIALVGDARIGLQALLDGDLASSANADWVTACQARRDECVASNRSDVGPDIAAIMDAISATLPHDAVVAKDATISAYLWGNRLLPVHQTRTAVRPTSQAIGPGVPLGLGAAVATRKPTVVIQGDGGLMLSIGELATAAQYKLPLIVCVFNDRGYGMLRFIQDMAVAGRRTGVELATPDFAAVGAAFGIKSARIASVAEFTATFSKAVADGGPWILDIDLSALTPMKITPQPKPPRPNA
ncbi:MAG: thiamine pyrophosphate-binding protein [Actinomycetia bacterium]|nr:thiamine pyrophosphate-binding protein [Actinomycetes bacterium]